MAVTARDITTGTTKTTTITSIHGMPLAARISAALFAFVIGFVGWCIGGRHTLYGAVAGGNMLLGWLGLPVTIPAPSGWWVLAFIPLAVVYSIAEVKAWPGRPTSATLAAWALAALVYIIVMYTDILTTKLGVNAPGPNPWPITAWFAANDTAGWAWAAILTIFPEQFMRLALWLLRPRKD